MNRIALSAAKPSWLKIENRPPAHQLRQCVQYVERILAAIGAEQREPDTWEALYLTCAIHAIIERRYFGSLTFSETAVMEPADHRPPRLLPGGPEPVRLEHLQEALRALKATLLPGV